MERLSLGSAVKIMVRISSVYSRLIINCNDYIKNAHFGWLRQSLLLHALRRIIDPTGKLQDPDVSHVDKQWGMISPAMVPLVSKI